MPTVKSHTATIYYERSGEGPALVFAHGAGGNTMSWWQQVPHFQKRHTVITFDHRRFARSRCPSDDFHPRYFADDLLAILDAEGIAKAALVCQSMGGWTGLRTALHHAERLHCLVLCGTPGGVFTPEILAATAKIAEGAAQGIRGNAALAPDYPERQPAMAHLYDQIAGRNTDFDPVRHLPRLLDVNARIDPASLTELKVPTLVIAGEHDQLFPPPVLHHVAELIPDAELADFPDVGHSAYFEDAKAFNARIDAFLEGHVPREGA